MQSRRSIWQSIEKIARNFVILQRLTCHRVWLALLSEKKIKELGDLGFNRISLGIQDVNQVFTSCIENLVECLWRVLWHCVMKLVWKCKLWSDLRPSFSNRKVFWRESWGGPWSGTGSGGNLCLCPHPMDQGQQNQMDTKEMPNAMEGTDLGTDRKDNGKIRGYAWIGMDHFAKKTDPLEIARGELKRNFQAIVRSLRQGKSMALGPRRLVSGRKVFLKIIETRLFTTGWLSGELASIRYYPLSEGEKYVRGDWSNYVQWSGGFWTFSRNVSDGG